MDSVVLEPMLPTSYDQFDTLHRPEQCRQFPLHLNSRFITMEFNDFSEKSSTVFTTSYSLASAIPLARTSGPVTRKSPPGIPFRLFLFAHKFRFITNFLRPEGMSDSLC